MSDSTQWTHVQKFLKGNSLLEQVLNHPAKRWVKVSVLFGELYESQDKQSTHANKRRLRALRRVLAVLNSVESTLAIVEETT